MNLPNKLTVIRIILAPVFFLLFWIPEWTGNFSIGLYALLIVVFLFIEVTDIADGFIARKYNLVTDLGKVLDPFSDVFSRLTYFVSFVAVGILHPVFCLLILYREFAMVFLRMVLTQRGIALAAKSGGKLKSVFYFISSAWALVYYGMLRFDFLNDYVSQSWIGVNVLFGISALLALMSFWDYLGVFIANTKKTPGNAVDSEG